MHLAFAEGSGGKLLARNSVMSYFRQVKNWLLEAFPKNWPMIEKQLLKQGQILEKYCLKRQQGGMVVKAPACKKTDLKILMDGLYYEAKSSKEYQDAALLVLMWYAFGRASDLGYLQKCNLSVCANNVLFLRFIRTKTSEEQGISLFPDNKCFITCPYHAIAMALAMQDFPGKPLLDLPQLATEDDHIPASITDRIPLVEALPSADENDQTRASSGHEKIPGPAALKIHAYVNRIVKTMPKVQARAKPTSNLSSHSFRRGGAQHANDDSTLAAQWIFDRGSWNMTATNKAFAMCSTQRRSEGVQGTQRVELHRLTSSSLVGHIRQCYSRSNQHGRRFAVCFEPLPRRSCFQAGQQSGRSADGFVASAFC